MRLIDRGVYRRRPGRKFMILSWARVISRDERGKPTYNLERYHGSPENWKSCIQSSWAGTCHRPPGGTRLVEGTHVLAVLRYYEESRRPSYYILANFGLSKKSSQSLSYGGIHHTILAKKYNFPSASHSKIGSDQDYSKAMLMKVGDGRISHQSMKQESMIKYPLHSNTRFR